MGPAPLPLSRSVRYGAHPSQVANLHLPSGGEDPWPCVVLLHGGFWRSGWDRTLMTPLAHDLARRGLAAWNVEFRGTGADGGGWPTTLLDVAAAVDHLAELEAVDVGRVATCGHSAGGHLALWAAARHRLPGRSPLASPAVRPSAAVSLAGVCDLVQGARDRLDDGAVQALLEAEPDDEPDRYALTSPVALAPLGARLLVVHGDRDEIVPGAQSGSFAERAARGGDDVELRLLPQVDHFQVIDAEHPAWHATADWLVEALVGAATPARAS